jgi:hypothetical protein
MTADQDVLNNDNGVTQPNNAAMTWRWVRVRARTVFGNLHKNLPFAWPNGNYAATTSHYDAETGGSEQISWRYVDSRQEAVDNIDNCMDFKDIVLTWWEHFLATTPPAEVAAAIAKAKVLRKWPTGFPGTPSYEQGQ